MKKLWTMSAAMREAVRMASESAFGDMARHRELEQPTQVHQTCPQHTAENRKSGKSTSGVVATTPHWYQTVAREPHGAPRPHQVATDDVLLSSPVSIFLPLLLSPLPSMSNETKITRQTACLLAHGKDHRASEEQRSVKSRGVEGPAILRSAPDASSPSRTNSFTFGLTSATSCSFCTANWC